MAPTFAGLHCADAQGKEITDPRLQSIARCIATVDACVRYMSFAAEAVRRNDIDRLAGVMQQLSLNIQEINQSNGAQLKEDLAVLAKQLGINIYSHDMPRPGGHDA